MARDSLAWGARLSLPVWDKEDDISVELVTYPYPTPALTLLLPHTLQP